MVERMADGRWQMADGRWQMAENLTQVLGYFWEGRRGGRRVLREKEDGWKSSISNRRSLLSKEAENGRDREWQRPRERWQMAAGDDRY